MIAVIRPVAKLVRERGVFPLTYAFFLGVILATPFGYSFRWIFYLLVIPCFLLTVDRVTLNAVTRSWVWRLAMLLLIYMWFSLLWAEHTRPADFFNYARRMAMIALFITMTAVLAQTCDFSRQLFRWLLALAAVIALATLILLDGNAWSPQFRTGTLTIVNPNVAAAIYGVLLVGSLFYVVRASTSRLEFVLSAAALAVFAVLIVLTKSRGNWLTLVAALCLLMLLADVRLLVGVFIAGIVVGFAVWSGGLLDIQTLFSRGDSYRLEAWTHFFELWRASPWFGAGVNLNTIFYSAIDNHEIWHAHNVYLAYLSQGGVVAFLLLLAMFGAAACASYRVARQEQDYALIGMLIYVAIYSVVDFGIFFENGGWQWLFFWLPLGLIAGAEARFGRPSVY